jgi:UDP-N-acetyl-D-glucosamine dehydrogenase
MTSSKTKLESRTPGVWDEAELEVREAPLLFDGLPDPACDSAHAAEERPPDHGTELAARIASRSAVTGVVGLGYVGLPLLTALASRGFPTIGLDKDHERIRSLENRRSYVVDVSDENLMALRETRFVHDPRWLREADVIILAVPTPLTDGSPDLSYIREASSDLAAYLRPGQLVVLESTTYPGTTEELVAPILETSGLKTGTDYFLAYSPERIDPGSGRELTDTPKLVAGVAKADGDLAELFYRQLVTRVVRTSNPRDAEMAKLIENTFRQVNIALVNEMATLAPALGVDIWAAIEAAGTKPFGYMPFWPGPGVGGHCIAIDPSYLSWRVGQCLGFGLGFVEHANEVNNRMPGYVAGRIGQALNEHGKAVKGSRVLGIGLAYKGGVGDLRSSPAAAVMALLRNSGADISYHDPYIPRATVSGIELVSQDTTPEVIRAQDCVTILTSHPNVDYRAVIECSMLVFDAVGVTRGTSYPNVVRL